MGAYTEIVDFTFTANETSRAFTGLNITKNDFLKIVMTHVNGSSGNDIRLFPNTAAGISGFNTATNYHGQYVVGNGTSVSAARVNVAIIAATVANTTSQFISYFKISENGKSNTFTNYNELGNSNIRNGFWYTTSSNLTFNDSITSLTFTSSVTNGILTGSRIQIYKLAAEKVADITVASNTTQVDISNLSIDKDSEYLLVSDYSPSGDLSIFPNNQTTQSNYYTQNIDGAGSSALANRFNRNIALYQDTTGTTGIAYTHIKLSNIGAYTHQSYQIYKSGTTTPNLINWFCSGTQENITLITSLSLVSFSNMTAGTRFTLYKLYE